MHLNNLMQALQDDPDLTSLPRDNWVGHFKCSSYAQGAIISHTSVAWIKLCFLVFFQHAAFITSNQPIRLLAESSEEGKKQGFLVFLQLVGTLYFKKNLAAFVSLRNAETLNQLFNSIDPPHSLYLQGTYSGTMISEGLSVTAYLVKKNESPNTLQCGVTGYVHAGYLRCGNTHMKMFTPIFPLQSKVGGFLMRMGVTPLTWTAHSYRREYRIPSISWSKDVHVKRAVVPTSVDVIRRETTVDLVVDAKAAPTYQWTHQCGAILWTRKIL